MKPLGWSLVIVGLVLCLTLIGLAPGLGLMVAGALMLIAAAVRRA